MGGWPVQARIHRALLSGWPPAYRPRGRDCIRQAAVHVSLLFLLRRFWTLKPAIMPM